MILPSVKYLILPSYVWQTNIPCIHQFVIPCFDVNLPLGNMIQGVTRSLFQFSRREREFLSFNLMFETRTRISFSQSRASRREREFLFSISDIETRTGIEIETILARIFGNYIYCLFIDRYFQKRMLFSQNF